ncbi:MAG: hypothetical protein M9897_02435 [Brumimicrobium sp.]|nr:hypothetical protein [Brumimicrobium sp.]
MNKKSLLTFFVVLATLFFSQISYSQVTSALQGRYQVISPSNADITEISANEIIVRAGESVVEQYNLIETKDDVYYFAKVNLRTPSKANSEEKRIYQFKIIEVKDNEYTIHVLIPNGKEMEIQLRKL